MIFSYLSYITLKCKCRVHLLYCNWSCLIERVLRDSWDLIWNYRNQINYSCRSSMLTRGIISVRSISYLLTVFFNFILKSQMSTTKMQNFLWSDCLSIGESRLNFILIWSLKCEVSLYKRAKNFSSFRFEFFTNKLILTTRRLGNVRSHIKFRTRSSNFFT